MANLFGQNIGTNYKGILSLDSTINTPLDATLRAVTDGEGNASPLQLSTDAVSVGAISGARLAVKGSSTTASTTALLVQNSAGTAALTVKDDLQVAFSGIVTFDNNLTLNGANGTSSLNNLRFIVPGATKSFVINADYSFANQASALLEVQSTTKGFLPPRMTTTQKNAIATPAAGLVVYDSTTNKLACYNGTTWNELF
jgi:hypothetical protein